MTAPKPEPPDETRDRILGGRVTVVQRRSGFRAAIDPVLLAAAVPAQAGERVLDVGTGTGAAALCLAKRVQGVHVTGLEIDAGLSGLAQEGAGLSGVADSVTFLTGDLLDPPAEIGSQYDHVMANPPHIPADSGNPPTDAAKRRATVESEAALSHWIRFLTGRVKDGGSVTLIHRFERASEIAAGLGAEGAGGAVIWPLWPKTRDEGAKRAIIQARGGGTGPPRMLDGLLLHMASGNYTPGAEAVLRDAQALDLGAG